MRPRCFCLLVVALVLPGGGRVQAAAPPASSIRLDALGDPLPGRAIARLGTSRFRLGMVRQTVALSPDGKTLAVLGAERDQVLLLDASSGRERRRLDVAASDGLAFLPGGNELICSDSGTITFWDLHAGKKARQLTIKAAGREITAVSADGRLLAAGARTFGRKAPLGVYDILSGRLLASLEPATSQGSAALSPDGRWLATWMAGAEPGGRGRFGGIDGGGPGGGGPRGRPPRGGSAREETTRGSQTVLFWDPVSAKELKKIDAGSGESVATVTFAPDGRTIAVATTSGSLKLWDLPAGKRLRSWRGVLRSSLTRESILSFSPDGKLLVLGARGGDPPLVWDISSGRRLRLPRAPECRLGGVGFPGGGRIIAFGLQSQAVVVWDLLSGKPISSDTGHSSPIIALTFRDGGRRLCTTAADGSLIDWDLAGKELRRQGPPSLRPTGPGFGRRPPISRSATAEGLFSPGGTYLARNDRFSGISVSDVRSGQEVLSLSAGSRSVSSLLAFSRDGAVLATTSGSSRKPGVLLYRMDSGEELASQDTETAPTALAFDPSGQRLAIALSPTEDGVAEKPGEVRVWRTDSKTDDPGFMPFALPPALGSASWLLFSPDGRYLLVAHSRGVFHLLDARGGRPVDFLDVNGALTTIPAFSPDGRSLAIAASLSEGAGHTVSLWEMASGRKRWSASVSAAVTALAFAPSGKVLATGHRDSSGMLWDVSGQIIASKTRGAGAQKWWTALLGDAESAFEAQHALACRGNAGVAAIRKRLQRVAGNPLDDDTLTRLVKELDAEEFTVRRRAFEALAMEGRSAEPHLRKVLQGKPTPEVRRRVRELLARLGRPAVSGEQLRGLRALEVLEWIGTAEAHKLVEELSRGRANAPLTREAIATLGRMGK
jgi:WD40 repeat protein